MKLSARGKKVLQTVHQNQTQFLQQLQTSLIQATFPTDIGIDQFQKLYKKKQHLSQTINYYQDKNKHYSTDIQKAKQRIYQIAQLNDKANKQSILMRNQINKINDAHMLSKILMMEKIIKLGQDNENLEKKKLQCNRIRQQKSRVQDVSQMIFEKKQRNRELSVMESRAMQAQADDFLYHTIEEKKSRAERVRSQKERRKERLQRYEKFKLEVAQKNYLQKTQSLKRNLIEKEKLLETLCLKEQKEKRHFQTTEHVTKQYIKSMYQTVQHSTLQNSQFFPTQAI